MFPVSRKRRGQSAIEFAALIMFILAAFIVFQKYIVRGFSGRWKTVGDALGDGRIYDPDKTIECASKTFFEGVAPVWYDQECFDANCKDDCLQSTKDSANCSACLAGCQTAYCSD